MWLLCVNAGQNSNIHLYVKRVNEIEESVTTLSTTTTIYIVNFYCVPLDILNSHMYNIHNIAFCLNAITDKL